MTNGDKARESLSKLSDYKIAHLIDFCGIYDECDDCPMNGMKKCGGSTPTAKQLWLAELKQRREAEISAKPKSNGDRIRQMTDEELADFLENNCSCPNCCIYHPASCKHIRAQCTEGYKKWLRKEVSEDAGTD